MKGTESAFLCLEREIVICIMFMLNMKKRSSLGIYLRNKDKLRGLNKYFKSKVAFCPIHDSAVYPVKYSATGTPFILARC